MKCQQNPHKAFIGNYQHCESAWNGPAGGGETREPVLGPRDSLELHSSIHLREDSLAGPPAQLPGSERLTRFCKLSTCRSF